MGVKFIKYMVVDGQDVTLDITQEITPHGTRCFRIDVHQDDRFEFLLCKDSDQSWQVITQTHPDFIISKLFEDLTSTIEGRLAYEQSYLILN